MLQQTVLLGFGSLMILPMTVDFKKSKCRIYVNTSIVCAGKGCMRELLQPANTLIFTHLGFGILILYKT
jgi:hypothetical protein